MVYTAMVNMAILLNTTVTISPQIFTIILKYKRITKICFAKIEIYTVIGKMKIKSKTINLVENKQLEV